MNALNIKDYIEYHNKMEYFNYCEAVIHPNGDIEDADYGHINTLKRISNLPDKIINVIMPNNAAPLLWLSGLTKCIPIWYDYFIYDSISKEQLDSLQELVNNNILRNGIMGYQTNEYERCELLKKYYNNEINLKDIPDICTEKITLWRK